MRATHRMAIATAFLIAPALPVPAHHSDSVYDTDTLITLEGTVTRYEWRNPHTYVQIETADGDGARLTNIEAGSISWLGPLGLARDSFQVGDSVTARVHPSRRNAQVVLGREIVTRDGTVVPLNASSPYIKRSGSTGRANDIAGTWVMQSGATDRMREAQRSWKLTDAGAAALAGPANVDTPQSRCIPMSVPNLLLYPVVNVIEVGDDAVRMRIDWMDSERVIYLDGRGHPDASQRFLHGHSVGRWEGEAGRLLVVETTNFADHAVGTGYGIPSGSG
ncbi:MAG TPA: DUF6152 family protein, partial [Gammaproteobacteria bacterium]|nr:DUF6152 family protein [Gammaproteobacteria bacterium]